MQNPDIRITTNIDTTIFYSIIEFLKNDKWILVAEYDENMFDKGIDFDYYEFIKQEQKIRLAWTNWFEGEIEANTLILNQIAEQFRIKLYYNEPEFLHKTEIIDSSPLIKRLT